MSAGRRLQQGVPGARGRGIGAAAGGLGGRRDDGGLCGNAGASAGLLEPLEGGVSSLGGAMLGFRSMRSLKNFLSVHASFFNWERSLSNRD